ncbi:unnamed protein product [Ixodes hexagonus]
MTRRSSWTTFVSRMDRDTVSVFSCWLLVLTSVGSFTAFVMLLGRQLCMVAFFVALSFVAFFVLFIQPPEGAGRRAALRNVLLGPNEPRNRDIEKNNGRGPVVDANAVEVGILQPENQPQSSPAPSSPKMVYGKDDNQVPPPVDAGGTETKRRGFISNIVKVMKKGRLQENPFYTTLTEQVDVGGKSVREASNDEHTGSSADQDEDGKPPREMRRAIFFLPDPEPPATGRKRNVPPTTPRASEFEITRKERDYSVFTTAPHLPSGLRPRRNAYADIDAPKLGAKQRQPSKSVAFHNLPSPSKHKAMRTLLVEDWRKVANSSYSTSSCSESETPCLLVNSTRSEPVVSRRRPSRIYSEGKTRGTVYLVKDPKKGFRKVYHVWSV